MPTKLLTFTPQASTPITSLTIEGARACVDAHDRGEFSNSARVAVLATRDDRIGACVRSLVLGFLSLPFDLAPNPGGGPGAGAARDKLAAAWPRMVRRDDVARLVRDIALLGIALVQRSVVRGPAREWDFQIEPWSLHTTQWDPDRAVYRVASRDALIEVTPSPSEEHGLVMLTPEGPDSWHSGAIRQLATLFVLRGFNYRDWARFCERHGMPIVAIKEPALLDGPTKNAFAAKLQKMGSEAVLRLPRNAAGEGFEVGLIEPSSTAWETYVAWQRQLDTSIAVVVNGQNLTTEVQGGSFAAAGVHANIRQDILRGLAEGLSSALVEQVIIPWGQYNIPGWRDDWAPVPTWRTERGMDPQTVATLAAGQIVTRDEARAMLGLGPLDRTKETIADAGAEALALGASYTDLYNLTRPSAIRALPKNAPPASTPRRFPYTPSNPQKNVLPRLARLK